MDEQMQQIPEYKWDMTKVVVWVVVVLAALGIAFWLSTLSGGMSSGKDGGRDGETVKILEPGKELVTAAAGNVVSDFPEEFLLERNAIVEESFSINYTDEGLKQPVVKYVSERSLEDNIKQFRFLLEGTAWTIVQDASPLETPVTFFYAQKADADINITFAQDDTLGATRVTISYLMK